MNYPSHVVGVNHVEPAPRRVRAFLDGEPVFDTTDALYVWERPEYPQYYVPLADLRSDRMSADGRSSSTDRGTVELYTVGTRERAAFVLRDSPIAALSRTVSFRWNAMDAWFEEDEQVFVHPRSPFVRVDALRSRRTVRVELEGTLLAESSSTVMVFETGLPTRYYFERTAVDFANLIPTGTVTACPYKGTTSGYWSARTGDRMHEDLAWCYDFPTRQVLPIAGMIAFYNERTDVSIDGQKLERPTRL